MSHTDIFARSLSVAFAEDDSPTGLPTISPLLLSWWRRQERMYGSTGGSGFGVEWRHYYSQLAFRSNAASQTGESGGDSHLPPAPVSALVSF